MLADKENILYINVYMYGGGFCDKYPLLICLHSLLHIHSKNFQPNPDTSVLYDIIAKRAFFLKMPVIFWNQWINQVLL
jgi:hypothetical protein